MKENKQKLLNRTLKGKQFKILSFPKKEKDYFSTWQKFID